VPADQLRDQPGEAEVDALDTAVQQHQRRALALHLVVHVQAVDVRVAARRIHLPQTALATGTHRSTGSSTVMRRDDAGEDAWTALWNGDEAHDVQATGMLSAIVAPLGAAAVPVWVASSFDGDLVLVPTDRLDEAAEVLQAAGHRVRR
jgi:hypothetical protein